MSARSDQLLDAVGRVSAAGAGRRGGARAGEGRADRVFAMALIAFFSLALLGAMAVGTSVYQRIDEERAAGEAERAALGVVANAVRAADGEGAVSVAEGPGGAMLVLTERLDSGTFETRFYLADGWIVEEYAVAGADVDPAGATRVAESSTLWFEVREDGRLLEFGCDEGSSAVALRAAGAASAAGAAGTGGDLGTGSGSGTGSDLGAGGGPGAGSAAGGAA